MKKAKSYKNKEYYLEVARKVFFSLGYKKTSLADIAQAARRAKTGIYYYFRSKSDIFQNIIEQEAKKVIKDLEQKLSVIDDPIEKVKFYFQFRLNHLKEATSYYAFLKKDVLEHLPLIEKIRERYEKIEKEILSSILSQGIKQGVFKDFDVEKVTEALAKLIRGIEIPHFIEDLHFSMEQEMMILIDIFVAGLRK
ncbi:MAG: TetR/AcrR family transcriptional regulator [Bacteroidales bacterium]|nr:TetR/AcrR family transcriptional regulator [Bacteroidales bacterium]